MKLWIQTTGRDEDEEFPDGATYDVLPGGVLQVLSGNDIHLYSPACWQRVTVDTRRADERDEHARPVDEDVKWQ